MALSRTVPIAVMVGSAVGHGANEANLPRGFIFKNATEIEHELKRNAQFEQEWKEGNYISNLNVSYSMSNCDQVCDSWCWATSATMCASAFGASGSCSMNEARVAGNKLGRQCDSRCSSSCDHNGGANDIADGIRFLSGHSYTVGGVLSQSHLDSALRHGPVVIAVQWSDHGGHAITISGGSGGKYQGHDPEGYPVNTNYGGLTSYRPPYLPSGVKGTWAESVYTNSGPSPSPPPSPHPSGCTDQPQSWKSSEGESCSVYVSRQYCTPDGREGRGWNHQQWGPITNYADSQGRSALDACCGCGGGNDGPSPVPPPSPSGCADQPENWKSSEGESCSVYVSHQYCTPDGREGRGWNHQQWGPITNYADSQGRSALDACCGCGGGSKRVVVV